MMKKCKIFHPKGVGGAFFPWLLQLYTNNFFIVSPFGSGLSHRRDEI